MQEICIIISSQYPNTSEEYQGFQREVDIDLATIKKTFSNATCIELTVPAGRHQNVRGQAETQLKQKIIGDLNQGINKQEHVTKCTIVLNSHGSAGNMDITDQIVTELVDALSEKEIHITRMVALVCNGLKDQSAQERRAANPMSPTHMHLRATPSSMNILSSKLSKLKTKIPQSFELLGFERAYNPVTEKALVQSVLKGEGGTYLEVKTKAKESIAKKIENIEEALTFVTQNDSTSENWNEHTNILSDVFAEMLKDIKTHFSSDIKPSSQALLTAIEEYATSKNLYLKDFKQFNIAYNLWKKEHKITNRQGDRPAIIKAYCDAERQNIPSSSTELATSSSASASSSATMPLVTETIVPHSEQATTSARPPIAPVIAHRTHASTSIMLTRLQTRQANLAATVAELQSSSSVSAVSGPVTRTQSTAPLKRSFSEVPTNVVNEDPDELNDYGEKRGASKIKIDNDSAPIRRAHSDPTSSITTNLYVVHGCPIKMIGLK